MRYTDFKTIVKYLNDINRNVFTKEEVKEAAQNYWTEYKASKENGEPTPIIVSLIMEIVYDMDYMDYQDTVNILDLQSMDRILKEFINEL